MNRTKHPFFSKKHNALLRVFAVFSFFILFSVGITKAQVTINSPAITVGEVLDKVEEQTDYHFIYKTSDVDLNRQVEMRASNQNIRTLLYNLFSATDITYTIEDNQIFLRRPSSSEQAVTQTRMLNGRVLDTNGEPLIAASVQSRMSKKGTVTDENGNFSLEVADGDMVEFRYIGHDSQVLLITDQQDLTVRLNENDKLLEGVIVTGYQELSANESTGSVGQVEGEIMDLKGNANVLESLEGRIAGLDFTPDPQNEGSSNFNVRGVTSLSANSQPLIVVDGFPLVGPIESINPYEIESVNVLKDASASSIYGARAANGVIVIKTKRGKAGRLNVSYRNYFTSTQQPDLAYRLNRVSSADLVDIQRAAAESGNGALSYDYWANLYPNFSSYFAYSRNQVYDALAKVNDGTMTQEEADQLFSQLRTKDNTAQLEDHFLNSPFEQQHSLTLSGGGDINTFRVSLNYNEQTGNWTGSKYQRSNVDLVNTLKVSNRISIDLVGNLSYLSAEQVPINENILNNISSYEMIADAQGNPLPVRVGSLGSGSTNNGGVYGGKDPAVIAQLKEMGLFDETYYPLNELNAYKDDNDDVSTRFQVRTNVDLLKNLGGQINLQYENGNGDISEYSAANSFNMHSLLNNTAPTTFSGNYQDLAVPYGARIIDKNSKRNSYTVRGQLDYKNTFKDIHSVNLFGGSEIRHIKNENTVIDRFGYDENSLLFRLIDKESLQGDLTSVNQPGGNVIAGGIPFNDSYEERTDRFASFYGNGSYGYDDRYIFSGSIRIDQSNLFGTDEDYRYKPFWSVGGKWRISEEEFFQSNLISDLSLRATYGINGNISNLYGPFNIARNLFSYRAGNIPALEIQTPAINDLRWESTKSTNIGLQASLLKDRINVTADYYNKKTEDVLSVGRADPTQGFSSLVFNDANITNKGIELAIQSINVQKENFSWSSFVTLRNNDNNITKAFTDETSAYYASGLQNFEGAPANSFWMIDYRGLNEDGFPVIANGEGEEIVLDNALNYITASKLNDLTYAGTIEPKLTGAITNNLNYKNFGLSFMFVGKSGHSLLKDSYNGEFIPSTPRNVNSDAANAWAQAGDQTDIPSLTGTDQYLASVLRGTSKNVLDADYLRLREAILTYNLIPQNQKFFRSVTFTARGNNFISWIKNDEGIDPESHGLGRRYFSTQPSVTFGTNFNF